MYPLMLEKLLLFLGYLYAMLLTSLNLVNEIPFIRKSFAQLQKSPLIYCVNLNVLLPINSLYIFSYFEIKEVVILCVLWVYLVTIFIHLVLLLANLLDSIGIRDQNASLTPIVDIVVATVATYHKKLSLCSINCFLVNV